MSEWKTLALQEAGVRLIDCVHKTPEARPEGIPYVAIPQMKNGHIDFSDARLISEPDYVEWTKKAKPQKYDVVLSRRTNPGVTAVDVTDAQFALGQNLVLLRADGRSVYPPFLRWLCLSPSWWDEIEKYINVGAIFSSLRCGDVPNFELPIPPLAEQREIAAVLGALDDKIELNRKTAAVLEEMARALYRSWFVDFDPVWAKAEGRPPAHMDVTTAALFPDGFDDAGLPLGWEVCGIDRIADFLNGAALQKFSAAEGEPFLPVVKIAELRNGVSPNCGRASQDVPDKYKISDGDILFSWSGSLLQRVWTGGKGALNQHLFKVTSTTVPKWYHYFAVDQHMLEFQAIAASKATTMGHIQRHHLTQALVTLPDRKALSAADLVISPLFAAMFERQMETQTLATLRDSLLPRLMSGELRVGAAREMLDEVA